MRTSTLRLARLALLVAILCITAPLQLPVGTVPVTLQTFFIAFTGALLGPKDGFIAVLAYLLLGAVGMPVFSGWTGGVGMFLNVTGGFLLGFPLLALLSGAARKHALPWQILCALLGLLAADCLGVLHLMHISGLTLPAALITGVWPFLAKDVVSIILAVIAARNLRRRLRL